MTFRKLMPLKILKDKVKTLGDENFDFECCDLKGKDEVSLLANEFKKSALKLKSLKEARNIFIRNIISVSSVFYFSRYRCNQILFE